MANNSVARPIALQAASKGFCLYHCAPLTGDSRECWMVQRGASMRFFESLDSLQIAVADMDEYQPKRNTSVEEDAIWAALGKLNEEMQHG